MHTERFPKPSKLEVDINQKTLKIDDKGPIKLHESFHEAGKSVLNESYSSELFLFYKGMNQEEYEKELHKVQHYIDPKAKSLISEGGVNEGHGEIMIYGNFDAEIIGHTYKEIRN